MHLTHDTTQPASGRFLAWAHRLAWGLAYVALGALGLVIGAWLALERAPWRP